MGTGIHFTLVGWQGYLVALIDRPPERGHPDRVSVHTDSALLCKDKAAFSMFHFAVQPLRSAVLSEAHETP